jgi:sugar/nucleoside kinase (ribokinase family)
MGTPRGYMDLVVIGTITLHSIIKTTLKQGVTNEVTEYTEKFSGSTLHVALNASILGNNVGVIAPVGRDAVGLMDILKRYKVDYSHIVLSAKKSPNYMEVITSSRHYILYYEGSAQDLLVESIKKEYIRKAKAVHVCFPDIQVTEYIVDTAKKEGVLTSVDTECADTDADIVFCEKESGYSGIEIVTDFEHGVTCDGDKIPVFKNDIYHEKGVKDAFIAGFLTRYIKSEHVKNAALYGACSAYLSSQTEQKVLTCTKKEVDSVFEQKIKSF